VAEAEVRVFEAEAEALMARGSGGSRLGLRPEALSVMPMPGDWSLEAGGQG
jgi:hypothetical protein